MNCNGRQKYKNSTNVNIPKLLKNEFTHHLVHWGALIHAEAIANAIHN